MARPAGLHHTSCMLSFGPAQRLCQSVPDKLVEPELLILPTRYGASGRIRTCDPRLRRPLLYPAELRTLGESSLAKKWSVRQDLNLRPLVPKTSALPSCATHRTCVSA